MFQCAACRLCFSYSCIALKPSYDQQSETLRERLPELVEELKDVKQVIFHCALSRERLLPHHYKSNTSELVSAHA